MVVLLLLAVRWLWTPSLSSPASVHWLLHNPWRESAAPALLVKTHVLLAVWLWTTHRRQRLVEPDRGARSLPGLLAAGVLLVVLSWAVQASVRVPLTAWEVTRIHP